MNGGAKRWRPNSTKRRRIKRRLAARDGAVCFYCGQPFASLDEATLDHLIPFSVWPTWVPANLVLACLPCNHAKADRLPQSFLRPSGFGPGLTVSTTNPSRTVDASREAVPDGYARRTAPARRHGYPCPTYPPRHPAPYPARWPTPGPSREPPRVRRRVAYPSITGHATRGDRADVGPSAGPSAVRGAAGPPPDPPVPRPSPEVPAFPSLGCGRSSRTCTTSPRKEHPT
ncbi:HNH endonuclease [Actinomadura sp. SCN-SB]|uniref:HNH endonuclease n=1 Tax=Actinomadura sp. SCN-SB TaxID=3373092 RepID=UPI003752586C